MTDQMAFIYDEGTALPLSPKELVAFTKLDPQLPHNGLKAQEPAGTAEQAIKLSHLQAQQRELLNEERVARFGSLSVGNWNHDLQLIGVRSGKGKFWQMMGYNAGSKKYLYPEEGLYLMEMNTLELFYQEKPLSLQQAYELLIPIEFSLEEYQTYAHLMRLGYIVTRHKQCDITEYEQRIKLFRNQTNRRQKARKKVQVWFDKIGDRVNDSPTDSDSDSGDVTDGSSYSCSSGNAISLNSAGDFDAQIKSSHQDNLWKEEKLPDQEGEPVNAKDMGDEGSSVYSDGPISDLSGPHQERGGLDFDHSLVNLLDHHKRQCSSSNEERPAKVLKRKNTSSWYMTSLNSAGSSSRDSGSRGPPAAKRPREALEVLSVPVTDRSRISGPVCGGDSLIQVKRTKVVSEAAKGVDPQSGIVNQEPADTSMDIDEFLQTIVRKMNKEKKRKLERGKNARLTKPYSRWNFTRIHIPDIGTGPPGPTLLPSHTLTEALRACGHETPKDLPQKADRSRQGSQKDSDNAERADSGLDSTSKQCVAGGTDGKLVKDSEGPPTNWREYKTMLKKPERDLKDLLVSPVSHLWSGSVQPLVRPADAVSPGSLMRQLQVIQSVDNEELSRSCDSASKNLKITLDVHLPDSSYKKTCPGKPAFHIVIFSVQDPVPELPAQMSILRQSGEVPLIFAIVDNADMTFCCFTDARRMTDIS